MNRDQLIEAALAAWVKNHPNGNAAQAKAELEDMNNHDLGRFAADERNALVKLDGKPFITATGCGDGFIAEISDLQIEFPESIEYGGEVFGFLEDITTGSDEDIEFAGKNYQAASGRTFTIFND